jgi:hypothetical protein
LVDSRFVLETNGCRFDSDLWYEMDKIRYKSEQIDFAFIMKRKNFVQDMKGFTRKFTFITMIDSELYIGHIIGHRYPDRMSKIEYEHLDEWIAYFDRI